MLGSLQNKLRSILKKIKGTSHFDEEALSNIIKDLQRALITSDVDIELVYEFSKNVKERIKQEKGVKFTKREQFIYVIYEELTKIIGKGKKLEIREKPYKILLVGLFGSGKTTTCGKLAKYYKKRGYKVGLIALDTYRPAAVEQLKQISKKVGVSFFGDEDEKNPVKVIKKYEKEFNDYDIIIGDSAGRDALNKELKKEIKNIKKAYKPSETLLVIPADIGKNAKVQARKFREDVNIGGVILTKMDGSAKGGGALTACYETDAPIIFLGTGEKPKDLEEFEPEGFISQLLGLGDLKTLLKKAEESFTYEQAEETAKKFLKGQFNFIDFWKQLKGIKKMGSLKKIMNLIPGMGLSGIPKNMINMQEEKMKNFEHILKSMTFEELKNPKIVKGTRIERIAFGSGVPVSEVRELIKSFKTIRKLSKKMNPRQMKKMGKNFDLSKFQGMIK